MRWIHCRGFQFITTGGKYDWCFSCCLGGTIALEKRFLHSCFHGASFHLFKWLLPYLGYLPSVHFFLMEIFFIVYYLRSRYIIVKYIEVLFRHLFALHMFWEFMFWMTFFSVFKPSQTAVQESCFLGKTIALE